MCVLLREVGPLPCCATPYSAPGVELEEFKLLKGRLSGSGVMLPISVSGVLVLLELVHASAPCPTLPLASVCATCPPFFFWRAILIFFPGWIVLSYNVFLDDDDDFIFGCECCTIRIQISGYHVLCFGVFASLVPSWHKHARRPSSLLPSPSPSLPPLLVSSPPSSGSSMHSLSAPPSLPPSPMLRCFLAV